MSIRKSAIGITAVVLLGIAGTASAHGVRHGHGYDHGYRYGYKYDKPYARRHARKHHRARHIRKHRRHYYRHYHGSRPVYYRHGVNVYFDGISVSYYGR